MILKAISWTKLVKRKQLKINYLSETVHISHGFAMCAAGLSWFFFIYLFFNPFVRPSGL